MNSVAKAVLFFALLAALPSLVGLLPSAQGQTVESTANPSVSIDVWNIREVMVRGGPLMWPIAACSLVTLTFALERLIVLRRGRVIPRAFVRKLFDGLREKRIDRAEAMKRCKEDGSPTAEIFLAALRYWGRPPAEMERAISDSGQREVVRLRRNLRALQGSANISTLLGLLGTVLGMIEAFNEVAGSKGLGRAEVLAGGIAQALLTTALGLVVAIPSLFLYTYFSGRIERIVYEIDVMAGDLVEMTAGALGEAAPPPAPKPSPKAPTRFVS